jgi:predicted ATPase
MVPTLTCILNEITIDNFKSFKHIHIRLEKFNVLVGPNGSGKTNFLEVFKFIKDVLISGNRPYIPYVNWWSYRNVVWKGNETLPIKVKLNCIVDERKVTYDFALVYIDGVCSILSEKLSIENLFSLEREGQILRIIYDEAFLKSHTQEIERELIGFNSLQRSFGRVVEKKEITLDDLRSQSIKITERFSNLLDLIVLGLPTYRGGPPKFILERLSMNTAQLIEGSGLIVISPWTKVDREHPRPGFIGAILGEIRNGIFGFTILSHPNIRALKAPSPIVGGGVLMEDASNLVSVLYQQFANTRRLPERIETTISELFPGTQIGFGFTSDGKVFLKMNENGVEVNPPGIPDGLYKLLAILTAIELNSSVLAIDEIENSLYKEALEYAIDGLRESSTTVIITTHSPLVVDMIKLEELLVVEKTEEGTVMNRVQDPEKIRKKLIELKITQSESWLYEGLKQQ